ncbi:MAG: primase [Micromonosporaceae bacterium]|nr:primase [Micromonosporaceae bacterium]
MAARVVAVDESRAPVGQDVSRQEVSRTLAGRIRDEDIAAVRERTSIVDVITEHVTLKPAGGGNLKGLCPFHDEKSPSFNVTPARGFYHCFGCGAGGD